MTKIRYLLLWVIVSFLIMFFVSWGIESAALESEARQVQALTELAADCALQAGQGIDDFFTTYDTWDAPAGVWTNHGINGRTRSSDRNGYGLNILYHAGKNATKYSSSDLFKWYFGESHASNTYDSGLTTYGSFKDRQTLFTKLYNGKATNATADAKAFLKFARSKQCLSLMTQIPYMKDNGDILWVSVPRIALIGAQWIWDNEADYVSTLTSDVLSASVPSGERNDAKSFGWKALVQNDYMYATKTGYFGRYFLTPSKVGVTYVSPGLVQAIYRNNLDIIMRYKYNEDSKLAEHNGILLNSFKDSTDFTSSSVKTSINSYNNTYNESSHVGVINNGLFTVNLDHSSIEKIEYKTVDVFNSANAAIIEQLYGGYVEFNSAGGVSSTGVMTANKLKDRFKRIHIKPDNSVYRESNNFIVVAKVTFSTDVILNHKTAVFTNWNVRFDNGVAHNYNDIIQTTGSGTNRSTRSKKYTYTRYYAVTA